MNTISQARALLTLHGGSVLPRNISYAALQAVVALAATFLAYRLLVKHVGLEILGLWSLLTAGSIAARLADVSGAGGLARFVAVEREAGRNPNLHVHTVVLTSLALNGLVSAVLWLVAGELIARFIEARNQAIAGELVPWAVLLIGLLTPLAAALTSAVDGLQRADIRATILCASFIVFLGLSAVMIPHYGIRGFLLAQTFQQIIVIVACWGVLHRYIPALGLIPYRWSGHVFRQTAAYGVKTQTNALASMLSDPVAKMLLSQWGGLSAVAVYELASRLVLGVRSLLVQAAQPLIPAFAAGSSTDLTHLLRKSARMASNAALLSAMLVAIASPVYSYLMLGEISGALLGTIFLLVIGYGINSLAVPHYLLGIALNQMRWNIASQFLMAISIAVAGGVFGPLFGSVAVVGGVVAGLILGAVVVWLGNSAAVRAVHDETEKKETA